MNRNLVVVVLLSIISSFAYAEEYCTGIYFRKDTYYDFNIVQEGITRLRGLATLRRDFNKIYFTFDIFDPPIKSRTAYLAVNDKTFHILPIDNVNTNYGDDINGVVYIGAENGLYRLNPIANNTEKLNVNDNVTSISMSYNDLYYVNDKNEVYLYKDGVTRKVAGFDGVKVKQFAINNSGRLLFLTNDDVVGAGYMNINRDSYVAMHNVLQNMKGKALAVDNRNVLYVCALDALYEYNDRTVTFSKVADLSNLQGIVFGQDNSPIYAASGYIIQLKPNPIPCYGD